MYSVIALYFFLLITPTLSITTGFCPESCQCTPYRVSCLNEALNETDFQRLVNETESARVGIMLFSHQTFDSLDMCLFKRFTKLREFVYTFSSLKTVPKNPDCIKGFGITNFQINNNEIESLSKEDFTGYSRIKTIWLSYNKIKHLQKDTFSRLHSAIELRLDENLIEKIDSGAFDGLQDLRALNLQGNQLTTIQNGVFQTIKRIGLLSLNNNKLITLASTAFSKLQIVKLNLRFNKLKEFPLEVFQNTSIASLTLSRNPLHCSCQVLVTLTSIKGANIVAKCETPEMFTSKSPYEVIRLVTDPCSNQLHCEGEDPALIDNLNRKKNESIVCTTLAPQVKENWLTVQVLLITIGVLVVISILSFVIGYNYRKRVTGTAEVSLRDGEKSSVKMDGLSTLEGKGGTYVRDQTHYVETLAEEESKEVTIKSVRRKISAAFFGPSRKQSLANTASVNGGNKGGDEEASSTTPKNNNLPAKGGDEENAPKRKKTVFQPQPVIREEECNGVNKGFHKE